MKGSITTKRIKWLMAPYLLGAAAIALAAPPYGEWGTPKNASALPGTAPSLNTPAVDGCVSLSRDGLQIYFTSNRTGNFDIYMAERASLAEGFGAPTRLPNTVNTGATEACPSIIGRNTLYFLRSEGADPGNLFVSRRNSGDWQEAVTLNPSFNSPLLEEAVSIFEDDDGREITIFSRNNGDGTGGQIFQSIAGGTPTPVAGGPNAAGWNNRAWISRDGLFIAFDSTRPGGQGGPDLWFAERDSTSEPFGPAYTLPELNSPGFDARPSLSFDGTQIFFSSNRPGSASPAPDIWVAERVRRKGPKTIEFPAGD